nr:hypothetical protein [Ktedonobacterales bacterium]
MKKTLPLWYQRALIGALGGCLATFPMTAFMEAAHRHLPTDEQYPLPPREITEIMTHQATQGTLLAAETTTALTYLAHFGMGSAAGALYGVAAPLLPGSSLVRGIGYGLCVWAGNYLGLLPALDILR